MVCISHVLKLPEIQNSDEKPHEKMFAWNGHMSYTEIHMQIIVLIGILYYRLEYNHELYWLWKLWFEVKFVCSTEMAGHFAAQVKAKKLVLTHFSQRYKGVNDNLAAQDADCNVKKLVKQAEKVFMTGSTVAAEDFLVIPITLT